jgi:hypothetical protein
MTTSKTIIAAIARSISHNEIAHVDLSDQLALLRAEAIEAGDLDTAQACTAHREHMGVEDIEDGVDNDDGEQPQRRRRALVRQLVDAAAGVEGDVENGDVHEMWGVDDDGNEWRVHIRLDD